MLKNFLQQAFHQSHLAEFNVEELQWKGNESSMPGNNFGSHNQ
jgi:hypothetical protein